MTANPIPNPDPGGSLPGQHPLLSFAHDVITGAAAVGDVDPIYLAPDQLRTTVASMLRATDLVTLITGRVLDACDGVAADDGFRDVAAWAAKQTRQAPGPLRALIKFAEGVRTTWASTADAVLAGEVNLSQARAITHCLDRLVEADATLRSEGHSGVAPDVFLQAEKQLIVHAGEFGPKQLHTLGERILSTLAPDVADRHEEAALAAAERRANTATRLTLRQRGDGTVDLHARISEAAADRLNILIDSFASPRTGGNDQPASGFGVTDPATGMKLPAERIRGHAFEALLENLDPKALPDQGGGATQVIVKIDYDTLITGLGTATLGDGTKISAAQARRLACQAQILPAVFGGDSEPLDLGRHKRLFSKAQRRLHALRFPTCQGDGCTVAARKCESHHLLPWAQGGKTDADCHALFCSHHHHRAHDPAYEMTRLPNGNYKFTRRH